MAKVSASQPALSDSFFAAFDGGHPSTRGEQALPTEESDVQQLSSPEDVREIASVPPIQATPDPYPEFPAELKELPRWVLWKYEERKGTPTKVPCQPSGRRASATNPDTWAKYHTAISNQGGFRGVGCIISAPYVGIDLDKCRNPENGLLEPWAEAIIRDLDSYTELSPSGRGLHIWIKGSLPQKGNRSGRVEMYAHSRYFTVTGEHLAGTPLTIEERDLSSLHSRLETLDPANKKRPKSVTSADEPKSKCDRLIAGEWEGSYPSQSEADLALCSMLAKMYGPDPERIDEEFRKSGLYRDKWNREHYRNATIQKAIDRISRLESGRPQYESQEIRAGSGGSPPAAETLDWRPTFKSYEQMEPGEFEFLVTDFLPGGVTFIGGLPAAGKTWFALSLAKALVTGKSFLGRYPVPTRLPVLYLIPEVGERAFRGRLEKMRLTNAGENFLCRTINDGFHLLDQPELLAAVKALNPVIMLDTAIRFSTAENENSASDNRQLTSGILNLIREGARGVIGLHHATKASRKDDELKLETALRGTGDLAAVCDAVWGVQCTDPATLRVSVQCLKARDFEMPRRFDIIGRPYINEKGNFVLVDKLDAEIQNEEARALDEFVQKNPRANYRQIAKSLTLPQKRIKEIANRAGWAKNGKTWERLREATLFGD